MRPSGRAPNELRAIKIERHYTCYAEGSVLVSFGNTKVLCNASFEPGVPRFLKGKGSGWLTAEYSMLPRSTQSRLQREATQQRQGGRTLEIQRLIGRALRATVDLQQLGENTLFLDCDVIQADGSTRTASITGAYVAIVDAVQVGIQNKRIKANPIVAAAASVSVGIYQGIPVLDLDYQEDLDAAVDMNIVMDANGRFIEVQGTAEQHCFSRKELDQMLSLAASGIEQLLQYQRTALEAK